MSDSPTRRKRYGSGICWDYMDKGICPCDALATFPEWHPQLMISSTTIATTSLASSSKGTIASMPKRIPEWIEILAYLNFVEGDPNNFAILNTTYEEREEVKSLGGTYSPGMKKWIVVQGQDLSPFAKWTPRIHGRDANEVVFHNMNMDMTTAVRELQRCGMKPSHIRILGDYSESNILRNCLAAMVQKNENYASRMSGETENVAKKRRLEFNEHGTYKNANGVNGSYKNANGSAGSMRPQFSSPKALQRFVTNKQNEQVEAGMGTRLNVTESSPNMGDEQNELATLLLAAKSALVKCNSSGGGISTEQKQFNESLYNVIEALTAKIINLSSGHDVDQTSTTNANSANLTAPSPERSQKQNLVTPLQKTG